MLMHNPPHPGEILRTLCLEPLGLSVTEAAKALGVSRKTLSSLLNGRTGISPEMAVRLSIAFETSAESWMRQQAQYDLWHAEQRRSALKVQKLSVAYRDHTEQGPGADCLQRPLRSRFQQQLRPGVRCQDN
jgi:addiction module HigA family antidote